SPLLPLSFSPHLLVSFSPLLLFFFHAVRKCRQIHHLPLLGALLGGFAEEASGQVVLVPAGLDEDDRPVRFETRVKVVVKPVPDIVAIGRALGLGPALDRVVDHYQAGPKTRHPRTHPDRPQSAPRRRLPLRL